MDLFKRTGALPSIEDFAKDFMVKKALTSELGKSIRTIQEENVGKTVITDNEFSNTLCNVLEAIFIHGLKDKLIRKISAVFGNNVEKVPEPQFWCVVSNYSHKNLIHEINRLSQITTDVGRGRAWLRFALNDGLIVSHVGNMLSDRSNLQKYYNSNAYIRDEEQSDIMKQLLEGLSVFTFELSCNASDLNIWNNTPLVLANLWTPPISPEPVMPAVDVIDFFTVSKSQGKKSDSPKTKTPTTITESTPKTRLISNDSTPTLVEEESVVIESNEIDSKINEPNVNELKSSNEPNVSEEITNHYLDLLEDLTISNAYENQGLSTKVSSSDSIPDFAIEITGDSGFEFEDVTDHSGLMGNRLDKHSGWSSAFDCDKESLSSEMEVSYDSLLQSHNKNIDKPIIGTPELSDAFMSAMEENKDCNVMDDEESAEARSPDSDFEIVPKYLTTEHADEETKKLMAMVGKICPEKGLKVQDFKCNACGRPIGFIFGKGRLCKYDGYYYCYECHEDDVEYIPARMIHNWDFSQYPVAKRTKAFLAQIVKDPILDIKVLNPDIYTAIEEMAQLQQLRTQLTFLRSYIFTCKQSIAEQLRKKLWPREYLFEHVHLYAIDDLLEIPSDTLAQTLQKAITFAKKHVSGCKLCLLKGFICEICNNPKPIYPFDVDTTYHCERCLAVYHAGCMEANKYCPKCIRKMKREKMQESSSSG